MHRIPRHLDIHSGIGGFALAARWSGYETVALAEIEPYCNELLAKRFPTLPNVGDVRKFCRRGGDCIISPDDLDVDPDETEPWCQLCEEYFGDCDCVGTDAFTGENGYPDVLSSGFPCQGVSRNGKGAGLDDPRSALWEETPRIAGELGVPFVILENVAALKTRGFDIIAARFESIGYTIGTVVVPGYAVGAAHQRERVFAVAHLAGERMEGLWPQRIEEPPPLAYSPLPLRRGDGQWETEPDFRRTVDGLPGRVDRSAHTNDRIHALGNAIFPQIACAIFDILPWLAKNGELFPKAA